MNTRLARIATVTAVASAAAVMLTAGPSAAAPPSGCPGGFQLLSVGALSALGYQVPGRVDDPSSGLRSFGRAGNGNGWVCAVPLGNQTWSSDVASDLQIYDFMDDTLRT